MNAVNWNPPMEDTSERLESSDEPAYQEAIARFRDAGQKIARLCDEDGIDGPHDAAWDDADLEVIELRATVRQLKAELELMRAEAGAAKCWHCRKPLPIRAFQCADLTEGRAYCSASCWIREAKDRASEEF